MEGERKADEAVHTGRPDMVTGEWERSPEQRKVCQVLETVAKEVGAQSITAGESPLPSPPPISVQC